jgi:hypothetical protein
MTRVAVLDRPLARTFNECTADDIVRTVHHFGALEETRYVREAAWMGVMVPAVGIGPSPFGELDEG